MRWLLVEAAWVGVGKDLHGSRRLRSFLPRGAAARTTSLLICAPQPDGDLASPAEGHALKETPEFCFRAAS
jgi:hypothetical protein